MSDLGGDAGFSLISVMIDFAIVGMAALTLASLIVYNRTSEVRLKRMTQGDQALLDTAAGLQEMLYSDLYNFCQSKGALNMTRATVCESPPGYLSSDTSLDPGTDQLTGAPKVVDVLRNWNGDTDANGQICVELVSCMEAANQRMLDVTIRARSVDPAKKARVLTPTSQSMTFRKTK